MPSESEHELQPDGAARELARYAEAMRARNEQLEADLALARGLQDAYLPQQYPAFPRSVAPEESALRFLHRYQANAGVSGDFFDVLAVSDTEAGVFICDVMGHGVRAALVTAMIHALIEELKPLAADPGRFLTELNHSLLRILGPMRTTLYATAFYGVADVARNELRYASAGHPNPLLARRPAGVGGSAAEKRVAPLDWTNHTPGAALGVFEDATYATLRTPLAVHDLLVLYTDGLCEVENPEGAEFGQEQVLAAVRERLHLPTGQIFDELLSLLHTFSGQDEFEDDVCLVGLEVARIGLSSDWMYDPLTGLFNSRYAHELLQRELLRAERNGRPVGVISLALRNLPGFIGACGPEAGELLLNRLGELLSQQTRRSDIACRQESETFLIVLPDCSLSNARRKAEQFRDDILLLSLEYFPRSVEPDASQTLSACSGVAVYPDHGATPEAVLHAATGALEHARSLGDGAVAIA